MQAIVKKQFVQLDGQQAGVVPTPERRRSTRCEKSVRLLKLENVARALEVTCSCGEVTVVEIEYPSTHA